ncbi:hypothetical protein D3C80_1420100 [compost metagenome]
MFVFTAIVQPCIDIKLTEAVDTSLHRQGIVLASGLGQCLDPLLCVRQLRPGFLNIHLAALGLGAWPGAEIQTLLRAQGTVGIGAQLKTCAPQGATLIALLVDQITEVQLAVAMAAVDLGPYLAGGVVHHPLVVAQPLDLLALVTAHQPA